MHEAIGHRLEGNRLLSPGRGADLQGRRWAARRSCPEFLTRSVDDPTAGALRGAFSRSGTIGTTTRVSRPRTRGWSIAGGLSSRIPDATRTGHLDRAIIPTARTREASVPPAAHQPDGRADARVEADNGLDDAGLICGSCSIEDPGRRCRSAFASWRRTSGETATDAYNFQAFLGEVNLASQGLTRTVASGVGPRRANFVGTPLNAARNILASGTTPDTRSTTHSAAPSRDTSRCRRSVRPCCSPNSNSRASRNRPTRRSACRFPGARAIPGAEIAADRSGPGRFWSLARPYLPSFAAGLILLLVTNALGLSLPWILREAIHAIEAASPLGRIATFAVAMAGIALAQAGVRTASRVLILGNSRRIAHDLRRDFFAHLQRLDAPYYDAHRTGDIMSRGVNDIQLIQSFFGPGVMNLLNTTIVYSATLVLLLRIDVKLTAISLALFPVLFFAVNRLSRRVYTRSKAVQEQLATISNRAQENISGIQQVKTYVQESARSPRFDELCAEFRGVICRWPRCAAAMLSLIGIVTGVGTLVVLFVGGSFVIEGNGSALVISSHSTPTSGCWPGRRSPWAGSSTRSSAGTGSTAAPGRGDPRARLLDHSGGGGRGRAGQPSNRRSPVRSRCAT